MQPFVIGLIAIAVIDLLVLFSWAVQWGKTQTDAAEGVLVLRYGRPSRWIAFFFAIILPNVLAAAVLIFDKREPGDIWKLLMIYAMSAGTGWVWHRETVLFRLEIDDDGLLCTSPWQGERFISWKDVDQISFCEADESTGWFIIELRGRRFVVHAGNWKFRVPIHLRGVQQFLEQCEFHLPAERLANAKRGFEFLPRPSREIVGYSRPSGTLISPSRRAATAGEARVRTDRPAGWVGKGIMILTLVVIPTVVCLVVFVISTRYVSGDQVVIRRVGPLCAALVIGVIFCLFGRRQWRRRKPETDQGWGLCLMLSAPLLVAGTIVGSSLIYIRVDSNHFEKRFLTTYIEVRFDDLESIELLTRIDQITDEEIVFRGLNFIMKDGSQGAHWSNWLVDQALQDILERARARGVLIIDRQNQRGPE